MTFQILVKLYFGLLKSLEFKTRLLQLPKSGYCGRGNANIWVPREGARGESGSLEQQGTESPAVCGESRMYLLTLKGAKLRKFESYRKMTEK